jgi:hypothetical protein
MPTLNTLTMEATTQLVVETCCVCNMIFAMPREFMERMRRNHRENFSCPAGHEQHYTGKTEAQKLRDELESERRRVIQAQSSRDLAWKIVNSQTADLQAERRSKAATKGHLTRMRNKVANGVCPVPGCHRHFDNVQAHLKSKHEGWLVEHDVLLEQA